MITLKKSIKIEEEGEEEVLNSPKISSQHDVKIQQVKLREVNKLIMMNRCELEFMVFMRKLIIF